MNARSSTSVTLLLLEKQLDYADQVKQLFLPRETLYRAQQCAPPATVPQAGMLQWSVQ